MSKTRDFTGLPSPVIHFKPFRFRECIIGELEERESKERIRWQDEEYNKTVGKFLDKKQKRQWGATPKELVPKW